MSVAFALMTAPMDALEPIIAAPERRAPVIVAAGGREIATTVRAGALVANRLGRAMSLVSVIEPVPTGILDGDNFPLRGTFWQELAEAARHRVERAMDVDQRGLARSVEILDGEVPLAIARAAREAQAPLIVMGIGRSRPIDRWLGTGTVLRTVRVAHCPVLAVGMSFTATPAAAAVGVDFSRASAAAAQSVGQLLASDATLHLVHVWQPANADDDTSAKDDDSYRRHLPRRFEQFVESLVLPARIDVKCETREGRPAECLTDFAAAHHVDVLAVGRHGGNLFQRLLIGGVAQRVLRSADCSVLIAPEPIQRVPSHATEHEARPEQTVERRDWASRLDAFTLRNAGRVVALEVNDPEHGVTSQELGYLLFEASYREPDGLVRIVLGETHGRREHAERYVSDATRLSIASDARGADLILRIQHGSGDTVLTLEPVVSTFSSG